MGTILAQPVIPLKDKYGDPIKLAVDLKTLKNRADAAKQNVVKLKTDVMTATQVFQNAKDDVKKSQESLTQAQRVLQAAEAVMVERNAKKIEKINELTEKLLKADEAIKAAREQIAPLQELSGYKETEAKSLKIDGKEKEMTEANNQKKSADEAIESLSKFIQETEASLEKVRQEIAAAALG